MMRATVEQMAPFSVHPPPRFFPRYSYAHSLALEADRRAGDQRGWRDRW